MLLLSFLFDNVFRSVTGCLSKVFHMWPAFLAEILVFSKYFGEENYSCHILATIVISYFTKHDHCMWNIHLFGYALIVFKNEKLPQNWRKDWKKDNVRVISIQIFTFYYFQKRLHELAVQAEVIFVFSRWKDLCQYFWNNWEILPLSTE